MNNPFEILLGFLDRQAGEVEGHSLEEPPTAVKAQVRDFARGALGAPERQKLFELLREHPAWISLLAEEARSARSDSTELEGMS